MYPKTVNRVHVFWGVSGKNMGEGHRNKNIKKQPFGDASALRQRLESATLQR